MSDSIRIQMMDSFAIYINEMRMEQVVNKTLKGMALVQFLILNENQPAVPNYKLMNTLWSDDKSNNPESALKTLISRTRAQLNQLSDGLGNCIVSNRGAYHWESLPGMTIDLREIEDVLARLDRQTDRAARRELYDRLLKLYTGDLLQGCEQVEWALGYATTLHNRYITTVYEYLDILKQEENYGNVINVCRTALDVDSFDDRLHMDMMTALIKTNRNSEALSQYKHVMQMHYRYLGIQPSQDMQEFYKQIVHAGKTLEFSLDSIRRELQESSGSSGAFVCEYAVFKEIYNLQIRNIERLGSTMFLAVVMIGNLTGAPMDPIKQDNIMQGLLEPLKHSLRKGDMITQVSPSMLAMLLPGANYMTSKMVMERVKKMFYQKYPSSDIAFNYRVGPISSDGKNHETAAEQPDKRIKDAKS